MKLDEDYRNAVTSISAGTNVNPYSDIGGYWPDVRRKINFEAKLETSTRSRLFKEKLLSSKMVLQVISGMNFWRDNLRYQTRRVRGPNIEEYCIMASDNGIFITFKPTPVAEKIVASMQKK